VGLTWSYARGKHRKIAATYTALPVAILLGISGGCIHDAESGVRDVEHQKPPRSFELPTVPKHPHVHLPTPTSQTGQYEP
jgi:hypothetical protein